MTTVRANAGRLRGEPYENHAPLHRCVVLFFFFQAEDGIRDLTVTGVQTCALPIYSAARERPVLEPDRPVESQELPVALELFLAGVLRQEEEHGVAEDVQDDEGEDRDADDDDDQLNQLSCDVGTHDARKDGGDPGGASEVGCSEREAPPGPPPNAVTGCAGSRGTCGRSRPAAPGTRGGSRCPRRPGGPL